MVEKTLEEIWQSIPEYVIQGIVRRLIDANFQDNDATYKIAEIELCNVIRLIESLGGKVEWQKEDSERSAITAAAVPKLWF